MARARINVAADVWHVPLEVDGGMLTNGYLKLREIINASEPRLAVEHLGGWSVT